MIGRPAFGAAVATALVAAAALTLGCARRPARSHSVAIRNFVFQPATLEVVQGDTIVWTNSDLVPHTATARDSLWDSMSIAGNGTWRFVARTPGRREYYCTFHPNMQGTIDVR